MLSNDLSQASGIIGFSGQGKPLVVKHLGRHDSQLKVFIIAGQHGDESGSREAAGRLLKSPGSEKGHAIPPLHISILEDANPDGSSENRRRNESGIDLNRDHLRLESKETQAIHAYVGHLRPHLVIDVHNYPPRRRRLLAEDRVIDADVFLDIPTVPDQVLSGPAGELGLALIDAVKSDITGLGFSCERYLLFKPSGKVRTSSLGLLDARNSLAVRYGVLSVLVEARTPTKEDGPEERERLVTAQHEALRSILEWAWKNRDSLTAGPPLRRSPLVPVRWKYERSDKRFEVPFRSARTGGRDVVTFTRCHADVRTTLQTPLPFGYAVPDEMTGVKDILRRHGFEGERMDLSLLPHLQPLLHSEGAVTCTVRGNDLGASGTEEQRLSNTERLDGYTFYSATGDGGTFLTLILEGKSRYGLWRHGTADTSLEEARQLPVLRVVLERDREQSE